MGALFSQQKKQQVDVNELLSKKTHPYHAGIFEHFKLQKDLFRVLAQQAQAIPIQASNVTAIREPCDFYDTLLQGIQHATSRVYLSSLYLGIGKHEQKLVHLLKKINIKGASIG